MIANQDKDRRAATRPPPTPPPAGRELGSLDPMDHMGMIVLWSHTFAKRLGGDSEEWIGVCWEVVGRCCQRFNPARNVRISTYCYRALRYELWGYSRIERLGKRLGTVSLQTPVGHGGACLGEVLTRCATHDMPEDAIGGTTREVLHGLSDRQREVLTGRVAGRTLAAIGADLGLSREAVRNIEASALLSLNERHARGVAPCGSILAVERKRSGRRGKKPCRKEGIRTKRIANHAT